MKYLRFSLIALAVSSCEALPDVSYEIVRSPDAPSTNEVASYALQETTLRFSAGKEGALAVLPGRTDHQAARIRMFDASSLGVDVDIGIVNFDNTDIPKEVTVKVTDGRKELIEKVGNVAATAVGLAAGALSADDNIQLPLSVNLSKLVDADKGRAAHVVVRERERLRLNFFEVPVDAIETAKLPEQPAGPYFYYAACRLAEVIYRYNNEDRILAVKVSDPSYLQRVRLPFDGKVTMHSECGASVTGKLKAADGAEIALIQALIEQSNAVKEALEKENDADGGDQ